MNTFSILKKLFLDGILLILFFCWLSPLSFSFMPVSTGNLVALVFLSYIFFDMLENRLNKVYFKIFVTVFIIIITYSLITTLNGNNDYSLTNLLFLHIIQYSSGAYFFFTLVKNGTIRLQNICFYLLFCGLFLSVCSILSYMSYEFKLSLSYLLPQSGNIDPLRINRVRGLSNSGGADHSMQLAICGIGYIYFYLKTSKILIRAILIALYCLLMFSTVFIARSGFLVEIVILFFSIIFFDKKKLLTILILLISISLSIFFVIMFLPFIDYLTNDVFSEETLPWFISLFSIFTDGEINSSNKDLISMLYVPDRLDILFFGSGGYQFFLDYARSDSGYVKFIFSIGLIPTVTFIFFLLYSNLKLFYKANKSNFYGILSIFIFMAILLNVKEPFLIKIGTVNMLYLSLFFAWNKLPVTK